jgi:hypothetical protein
MKRKVWVVSASTYDIYDIWGIFTTKKKAEKFKKQAEPQARIELLDLSIEPYHLNRGYV